MIQENKPNTENEVANRETKMLGQGIIMWFVLIIAVGLIWTMMFSITDFIQITFVPTYTFHFITAIFVAALTAIFAIIMFRKRYFQR
jgi:membrane protein YdbS with pleckstrin-like domain